MSELCLLLRTPTKKTSTKREHHKKGKSKTKAKVSPTSNPSHADIADNRSTAAATLRLCRMRMRRLSLPPCPDFRNVRVGNRDEEVPTEWELAQLALDKLKLKRQQSLAQRHMDLIRLRQQLMAESMEGLNGVTSVDFMTPTQNGDFAQLSQPSLMFQRTNQKHSLSMQNLVEFGQMEAEHGPFKLIPSTHGKGPTFHLSNEKLTDIQRKKRLEQLRIELDEFKAVHFQNQASFQEEDDERGSDVTHNLLDNTGLGGQRFRGSNFTLVSLEGSDTGKDIPDIAHRLQKLREKELRRIRKQNMILEYRLKQQLVDQ